MKYLMISLLFLLSGCIQFSHDLGDGYILGFGTDNFDRIIYIKNTEGGKRITYFEDSNKKERYFKNEEGIVTSYVSQVAFDGNYIIVDQKPIDSICECNVDCLDSIFPPSESRRSAELCELGIKNSVIHNYYIINKEKNLIFGPLSNESLKKKLKYLGVKTQLNFKFQENGN